MTALRAANLCVALAVVLGSGIAGPRVDARQASPEHRVAWRLVDLATGRIVDGNDPDLLARPVLPGSLMKLPALVALLESGAIAASTRIDCPGLVVIDGRRIACQHARRSHALGAPEALALSCNVFFARASARLTRGAFNGVLDSFGWPAVPASRPLATAASGIEGTPIAPSRLMEAWQQLLADPPGVPMRSPTRKVVHDALAAVAREGTAAAFRERRIEALAKTGTSTTSDGRSVGLVLAAWPASRPSRAALVMVEGGVGPDAAAIAATLAAGERPVVAPPPREPTAPAAARQGSAFAAAPAPPARTAASPAQPGAPAARPLSEQASAPRDEAGVVTIRVGTPQPGGKYAVRSLPIEDYVARVLAGEAAPRTPPAALEALAITARTFAFANRRRHARDGFDLCDSTHCQVLRDAYAATRAAAEATAGQVLAWRGAPASVYYTASCGGRTERPSAVWPGAADPPFLPSRKDRGCGGEPKWDAEISDADLHRALLASGYRGARLRKLKIRQRAASGRVATLTIDGMTPGEISGQDFRMVVGRTLGWTLVRSTAFDLSHHGGTYTLKGHGYGHGVGFCVIGSMRRAANGESRASLLQAYFPGLQVADYHALRLPAGPAGPVEPPLASGEVR